MRRCFCLALHLFSISSPPLLGLPRFLSSLPPQVLPLSTSAPLAVSQSRGSFRPAAPPALELRGWLPHCSGLLHLLAGTLRDYLDNCFSALFGSAFGAEAALSMRACCPSWVKAFHFSSTRTPQPVVILPVLAQHRRFVAARLQGCLAIPGITILALSSIAVLSQATPKCVSPRNCRGSALVSSGPPPTFSILAHCGGIVGVSFWGIVLVVVFFWKRRCLTTVLLPL